MLISFGQQLNRQLNVLLSNALDCRKKYRYTVLFLISYGSTTSIPNRSVGVKVSTWSKTAALAGSPEFGCDILQTTS